MRPGLQGLVRSDAFAAAAITLVAAALGTAGLVRHELWRDEAYTWLVLRSSRSVGELLENLGYNGHPRFYYVLHYGLTRLVPSMWAIRALNLALALGALYLFAAGAPFTRLQKLWFALGFFPLYQYGVHARSYALLLLLLFAYCWLRAQRPQWLGARLGVLALFAQVHLYSAVAAGVLVLFDLEAVLRAPTPRQRLRAWLGCAGVVASLLFAVLQMWPPAAHNPSRIPERLPDLVPYIASGMVPAFDGFPRESLQRPLAVALWLATWLVLWKSRPSLVLYALLTLALTAMLVIVYPGHRWHHGFYFVFFVTAAWHAAKIPSGVPRLVVGILFLLHAVLGLRALGRDLVAPYSNGSRVAEALVARGLDARPLIGIGILPGCVFQWDIDQVQPVLAHLPGKTAFNPRTDRFEPFWQHYLEFDYFSQVSRDAFLPELQKTAGRLGRDVAIIAVENSGQPDACALPPPFEEIGRFLRHTDYGERYILYRYLGPP